MELERPMLPVLVNVSIAASRPFPALLFDGKVMALAHWRGDGLRGTSSMIELLEDWTVNVHRLTRLCRSEATHALIAQQGAELSAFRLHAPVVPRQVYCTIGNYRCQVLQAALDADGGICEAARREAVVASIETRRRNGAPYVCLKGSASVSGPFDRLSIEAGLSTLDWEAEIGVVIGTTARSVEVEDAFGCVAGYCVVNDLTARDRVIRTEVPTLGSDWLQSKSRNGWLPTGPWLVPAWSVDDPSALRPWLRLNGDLMQNGVASNMIFGIAEQIAYLSTQTTLYPGDLICTGTPAGIGSHYGRYLRAGDIVEAGVSELGAQRVVCVDSTN